MYVYIQNENLECSLRLMHSKVYYIFQLRNPEYPNLKNCDFFFYCIIILFPYEKPTHKNSIYEWH